MERAIHKGNLFPLLGAGRFKTEVFMKNKPFRRELVYKVRTGILGHQTCTLSTPRRKRTSPLVTTTRCTFRGLRAKK